MTTKMVLRTSLVALLLLVSCGQSTRSKEKEARLKALEEKPIDASTVDATPEQLAGIWEITEMRTDPNAKGIGVNRLNEGVIIGFTDDARMSTTSLGLDHMKETLEYSTIDIKVENGFILSADDSEIYKMQWGDAGIGIFKIGKDELCLSNFLHGAQSDWYAYFKRVD